MASIEKHHEKKFGFRVRLSIKIAQKDKFLLDEIQRDLNYGYVRLNRNVHEYDIKNQEHIIEFIDLIYPYSRIKRNQLVLAREIASKVKCIDSKDDLYKVALLADALAAFNVRSKNRRKNYATKIQVGIPRND